jgi:hypothetical protein
MNTLKSRTKLRSKIPLALIIYNETRWDGKFRTIERGIEIKEFIDERDYSLIELLPTPQENLRFI